MTGGNEGNRAVETQADGVVERLERQFEEASLLVTVIDPPGNRVGEAIVTDRDIAERGAEVALVDAVLRAFAEMGGRKG